MQLCFIILLFLISLFNKNQVYTFKVFEEGVDTKWNTDPLNNVTGRNIILTSVMSEFTNIHPNEFNAIIKFLNPLYTTGLENTEVTRNITELIQSNGFKVEEHQVETMDGYIVTMFRIPGDGPTIFLMHGILLSADDWVTAGRETGLAYLLAENGFDVWMGNARGTKHSRRHKTLSPDTAKFWDFSYYEIGIYDVPSMIDYVLDTTNQSQLIYVGHSQGTTSFFVMCSEKLEYNSKISLMIALAPAAAIPHVKAPLISLLNVLTHNQPQYLFKAMRQIGYNEFIPGTGLLRFLTIAVCGNKVLQPICDKVIYLSAGYDYSQTNYTSMPTVYAHVLSGSSTKQVEHYAQTVSHGKFCKFDYGRKINIIKYGSETPPEFPIGNISTPIALIYGRNDWLASVEDLSTLRRNLRSVIKTVEVPYKKFDHLDFVYAKDFKKLVFSDILELINKHRDTHSNM